MILKGSQRGGPRQLAAHLLNDRDNDHVTLTESRGFVSDNLFGAMAEIQAVAKGTRCRQTIFSLSLSPPKDESVSMEDLVGAVDRTESALGLTGQPRAIVIHEKDGRKHAHAVWSRIDATNMKAINMAFYKAKLNALSKELYLENEWELPEGHKTNGWKNPLNFTLAEWQQAKRLGIDPREIKQVFQAAWQRSDNLASFKNALEENGYYLAQGDRRGFVALDVQGEVYSVSKWSGVRTKELNAKLGKPDKLPGVEQTREANRKTLSKRLRDYIASEKDRQKDELQPLKDTARTMAHAQRKERAQLKSKQDERWKHESKTRAAKFRRGLGIVLDVLSGRLFTVRKENEREAFAGYRRDIAQREQLGTTQLRDRAGLQTRIDALKDKHKEERTRLARQVSQLLEASRDAEQAHSHHKQPGFEAGP